MRPGDLADRITLEEITGPDNGAWTTRARLWAAVEWRQEGQATIRLRYDNDLKSRRDIGRGMRVLFEGHVLMVDDVTEVVRAREVHLQCHDVIAEVDNLATGARGVATGSA